MIPPNSTPAAPPRPFIAAQMPIARCSFGPGGNEAVMIASDVAAINAPARPCTARAATSTIWSGAAPPASEASPNRIKPATSVRRCPKWSATRPPSIRKPANVIAYASTTHCRSGEEKPRSDWIDGSATLTMLRSRMTMNCATQQTASSSAVPEPSFLPSAAGTCSGPGEALTSTLMRDRRT